jgi:hypothetical protein
VIAVRIFYAAGMFFMKSPLNEWVSPSAVESRFKKNYLTGCRSGGTDGPFSVKRGIQAKAVFPHTQLIK